MKQRKLETDHIDYRLYFELKTDVNILDDSHWEILFRHDSLGYFENNSLSRNRVGPCWLKENGEKHDAVLGLLASPGG